MARIWPLYPLTYNAELSAYASWRRTPEEGGCGVRAHPCQHWGVDLRSPEGTPVHCPEDGEITHVAEAEDGTVSGTPSPFRGFGPAVVVVKGEETGLYHLLAHLRKGKLRVAKGSRVRGGQIVGELAALRSPHVHWQVQTQPTVDSRGWEPITKDPIAWGRDHGARKAGGLPWELALLAGFPLAWALRELVA